MQFETKIACNKEITRIFAKLHCNNYKFLLPAPPLPDRVVHSYHPEPSPSCHHEPFSCHCERPTGTQQSTLFPVIANPSPVIASEAKQSRENMRKSHSTGLPRSAKASLAMTAAFSHQSRHAELVLAFARAFSLVEMLMALLVASLLLAALAPVMTRRMSDSEIKVMSEAANYDKDTIISLFTQDADFTVPIDANQVRATIVGGGGAGGKGLYGSKEVTASESGWVVPENVTKLRVFMVGAGGGGASGGTGKDWVVTGIPATSETYYDYLAVGEHKVSVFPKTGYGAPEVDSKCKAVGETQWTYIPDETIKVDKGGIIGSTVKVTGCGGGGGGNSANYGYSGAGGSGGFISNKTLNITTSSIYIKIGSGGGVDMTNASCYAGTSAGRTSVSCEGIIGGNGSTGLYGTGAGNANPGGNGSYGTKNILLATGGAGAQAKAGNFYAGNGGYGSVWAAGGGGGYRYIGSSTAGHGAGGGGPTTVSTKTGADDDSILFQAGGGGGGGGHGVETVNITAAGGGGGAGGGYGAGGGGGGAGTICGNGGAGGKGLNSLIGGGTGSSGQIGYATTDIQGKGGAGGGGYGGVSGNYEKGGVISSSINIFGSEHCNGGNGSGIGIACEPNGGGAKCYGNKGKDGALRLIFGGSGKSNLFKCPYFRTSYANSGGGGGAGQIWIGEIDVTAGQIVNFTIGQGGAKTTAYRTNGNDGASTSITIGGTTYSVSGGKGGKYETDDTYITNSGGYGGGLKTSNFSSSARYLNWTEIDYKNGGAAGGHGNTVSSGANGGNGGISYTKNGAALNGGSGGSSSSNGIDAAISNYGAGGGGGGGAASYGASAGHGGRGANGYIYIEWGGTNGGGGTMGEIIKKTITNFDGDTSKRVMKIKIGKGGDDSDGGTTTVSVLSGGKTVTHQARGGLKGNNGGADDNGEEKKFPNNYSELYKEFVQGNMNLIIGQKGTDDYGGIGGYLACILQTKDVEGNSVCLTNVKANDGNDVEIGPVRPGCGGTSIPSPLYEAICNAKSTTASPVGGDGTLGGGGGGGAVLNNTAGKGGKGGDGFVILEYKSTRLD